MKEINNLYQFRKYLIVGFLINCLGLSLYILFTSIYFFFEPVLVVTLLNPLIIIFHFYLQGKYVYKISKLKMKHLIKYTLNFSFFYFLNIILIYLATQKFSFNHIFSQIFIVLGLIIFNFLISKNLIFNNK